MVFPKKYLVATTNLDFIYTQDENSSFLICLVFIKALKIQLIKIYCVLTYNISLNNCIKDINEGNVLDSLTYNLNLEKNKDTTSLSGRLVDAYSFNPCDRG